MKRPGEIVGHTAAGGGVHARHPTARSGRLTEQLEQPRRRRVGLLEPLRRMPVRMAQQHHLPQRLSVQARPGQPLAVGVALRVGVAVREALRPALPVRLAHSRGRLPREPLER